MVVEASAFSSADVEDIEAERIAAINNPIIPTGKKFIINERKI